MCEELGSGSGSGIGYCLDAAVAASGLMDEYYEAFAAIMVS